MSITSFLTTQLGQWTRIDVVSDLGGTPTFFWYVDGSFYARTILPQLSVYLAIGDQADVVAVDTLTPDTFDVAGNAPASFSARRTLWWVRSTALDVAGYVVKQQKEALGLVEIGNVPASDAWSYRFLTPRLDDLTNYDWEILPVDRAGNEGTALALGPELIVRKPDAPDFTIVFTPGTLRVEFFAA